VTRRHGQRWNAVARFGVVALALVSAACAGGCQLAGVMAASEERYGSHTVTPEYTGLVGQDFAVVAWTDRATQMEYPSLLPSLIQRVDLALAQHAGASGHVEGDKVTSYLANTPQWVVWPRGKLTEELGEQGVDRVVFIEINEFRTNEPGNEYLWDGVAWATVSIIERGTSGSDAEAFRKDVRVTFPDSSGYGPEEISRLGVASTLSKRLVDRVAWLFFEHDEANALEY
jgi:hypothetical protein